MKIKEIEIYVSVPELHEILVKNGLEGVYKACGFASCEGVKNKIREKACRMVGFLRDMGFDFSSAFGLNSKFRLNHHHDNTSSELICFTFNSAHGLNIGLNEVTRQGQSEEEISREE